MFAVSWGRKGWLSKGGIFRDEIFVRKGVLGNSRLLSLRLMGGRKKWLVWL